MVSSLVVGMLLTCVAFWCFLAACVTGFMCAGAGFGADPSWMQQTLRHSQEM